MPLVCMDAKLITNIRTAATSVLASNYLAKESTSSILILGNGSLSPFYIEAYASKSSVKIIYLWGRDFEKSKMVVSSFGADNLVKIEAIEDFEDIIKDVDIISCITSSHEPLVYKQHLSVGQHLDLAGSFTPDMHEVDTEVVVNSSIYTDNFNVTIDHSGELVKAIKEKEIYISDIKGDLMFLCKDDRLKRKYPEENTLFKCTGMAIEDLVIASLAYKEYSKNI